MFVPFTRIDEERNQTFRSVLVSLFIVAMAAFALAAPAAAQDIDCPEISYERAQEILAESPSDPHDLDRDNDGEACENNARSGGGAGDNGDDNGDDNGTTTLPETGTGAAASAGTAASVFGAVAGLLLIVGAVIRRTAIFRA